MTDQPPDPQTAELEARIAALERRSRRAMPEGRSEIETAFWAAMHKLFPDEARRHMKVAGREQLLAARVYLDKWIARLDEQEAAEAAGRAHEKIEVE
jgi:hypothetical protein